MKKRQKIIVSITGIIIILLILIGLTYAYFLTRIKGNTNEKTIGLKTANLEVKYQDGSDGIIIGDKIQPGTTFKKNFSVKNIGDDTGNYSIILDNIENTIERTWDIRYVLKNKGGKELVKGTLGKELTKQIVYADINIEVNKIDEYIFELEYEETNEDQSIDMKKAISLKIDIIGAQENIFKNIAEEGTLLYAIGKDNKIVKPLTTPGQQGSLEDEAELSYTEDDYGTSYYYRGSVKNNFVTFAGMCWRIVRTLGNGNIKLVLFDKDNLCSNSTGEDGLTENAALLGPVTYSDNEGPGWERINYKNSNLFSTLDSWWEEKNATLGLENTIDKYVERDNWCVDTSYGSSFNCDTRYGTVRRNDLKTASVRCHFPNQPLPDNCGQIQCGTGCGTQLIESQIGALTYDEIILSGEQSSNKGKRNGADLSYLNNNITVEWWTISPWNAYGPNSMENGGATVWSVPSRGTSLVGSRTTEEKHVRPAITLSKNVLIESGNGTIENPYIISNE